MQRASPDGGELCFRAVSEVAYVDGRIHTHAEKAFGAELGAMTVIGGVPQVVGQPSAST